MSAYNNDVRFYSRMPARSIATSVDGKALAFGTILKTVETVWITDTVKTPGTQSIAPRIESLPSFASSLAFDETAKVVAIGMAESLTVGENGQVSEDAAYAKMHDSTGVVITYARFKTSPGWSRVSIINSTPLLGSLDLKDANPKDARFGQKVRMDSAASVIAVSAVPKIMTQAFSSSAGFIPRIVKGALSYDEHYTMIGGIPHDAQAYTGVARDAVRTVAVGTKDTIYILSSHSLFSVESGNSDFSDLTNAFGKATPSGFRGKLQVPTDLITYSFGDCEISGDGKTLAAVLIPHDRNEKTVVKIAVYQTDEAHLSPSGGQPGTNKTPLTVLTAPAVDATASSASKTLQIGTPGKYQNYEIDSLAISYDGSRIAAVFPNIGRMAVFNTTQNPPSVWISDELFIRRVPTTTSLKPGSAAATTATVWNGVAQVAFVGKSNEAVAVSSVGGAGTGVFVVSTKNYTFPTGKVGEGDSGPIQDADGSSLPIPPPPASTAAQKIDTSKVLKMMSGVDVSRL